MGPSTLSRFQSTCSGGAASSRFEYYVLATYCLAGVLRMSNLFCFLPENPSIQVLSRTLDGDCGNLVQPGLLANNAESFNQGIISASGELLAQST